MKLKEFTKRLGTTALICSLLLAQSTPAFAAEISAAPAPSAEEQLTAAPGQEAESTPSAESPEENTPEEFFANPKNPRLKDFLSKVL